MPTMRQLHGRAAEDTAAHYLAELGWQLIARNLKLGRDEIDIVAIDPGPPPELVCVEVRSGFSAAFGAPEERVDRAKVGHLYRAARALVVAARLVRRVDLVVVDRRSGTPLIRHMRSLAPP